MTGEPIASPLRLSALLTFAALAVACNSSIAIQQPTPTPAATAAPQATATPQSGETSSAVQTYTWSAGGLSIQYPSDYQLYSEQKPGVDGVVAPLPNGIALVSTTSPNFVLSIQFFPQPAPGSLHDFVLSDDSCPQDPALGQEVLVAGETAWLFPDTPCGPYGSSLLYLVRQSIGYRITVETHATFQEISFPVLELLSTIAWLDAQAGKSDLTPAAAEAWDRARVGEAHLLSSGAGWVLTSGPVLWTTDGGETWLDITPPGASEAAYRDVFFLDANLGWATLADAPEDAQPSQPIQILHTQDGGTTWTSSEFGTVLSLGAIGAPRNLEFVDREHGWLSVSQTLTMNSSAADLYRTTDGGLTWERLSLPFDGDTHFITPSLGWIVGSCCTGAPSQLYRTVDGGITWQKQEVAPNPVDTGFDYHDYSLPDFLDERTGALAITLREEFYEPSGVALYRTQDSGETWDLTATLPTPPGPYLPGPGGSPGISIPAQFLPPETWFVAMGETLYRSLDGGATWEELPQAGLPGFHSRLQFVNMDSGWSVLVEDNCGSDCNLLARTVDGGHTWTPVVVEP